ncbi:hypothetical protein BKA70DRAFT_1397544 [Coprinopsis sp. MPI-PUGE-AT-0042]|nr:hypothetical protein BKA70DRAFT_1397544 [Coprinopsis sp. MPI-PUGE-AT-0042]
MPFTTLATLLAPAFLAFATCGTLQYEWGEPLDGCIGIGEENLECDKKSKGRALMVAVLSGSLFKNGCHSCEIAQGAVILRCECEGGPKTIDIDTRFGFVNEHILTC